LKNCSAVCIFLHSPLLVGSLGKRITWSECSLNYIAANAIP
jgi:hypothetical protein